MRQMATNSSIAPITAISRPKPTNSETDTRRNVRLAFGEMQEIPDLKLSCNGTLPRERVATIVWVKLTLLESI